MLTIKSLPKKFEKYRGSFLYNDEYITDGRFAIRRSLVKDSYKYCLDLESNRISTEQLNRVIDATDKNKFVYVKTNRLWDYGSYYVREFVCKDHFDESSRIAYINDEFVQHFEIENLNGFSPQDPFVYGNKELVIMPCRAPKEIEGVCK